MASVHHLTKMALKSSSYEEYLFTILYSVLHCLWEKKNWDNWITVRQGKNISPKQIDLYSANSCLFINGTMHSKSRRNLHMQINKLLYYLYITIFMLKYKKPQCYILFNKATFLYCQLIHHGKTASGSGLSNTYS